ncbi:MAG: glycosyltransferase family 39 protein [Saprospirales bacterium]|nr:glycosyltransferase family 39 protein [Saprospirales bacterium]
MTRSTRILLILFGLLLLPALLTNLGLMTFIDDEAIRSLVALEMKLSGNYIAPTLNGEWYYNKPPLFNWILLGYFNLFGVWEEWVPRLATVVSLLGYGATIFYFFRKHYTTRLAWIVALSFITCGRVLLWDSQLGLIDITFSWVTFLSFMVVYHAYEKQRWWTLFLVSYTLAAAGFMMKGLPSVVFQGLTLLVYFGYRRAWSRFFSLAHVAGGFCF